MNVFSCVPAEETGGVPVRGDKRPKWSVFGKVSQNMETTLFKEKFIDWPDASRIIKVKDQSKSTQNSVSEVEY